MSISDIDGLMSSSVLSYPVGPSRCLPGGYGIKLALVSIKIELAYPTITDSEQSQPLVCDDREQVHLQVKDSLIPGAGQGLFAQREFIKDETICEYTGTQLTLLQTIRLKDKTYLMGGFGLNCHIDAKDHPNVLGRYINDARDPEKQNSRFVKLKPEKKALVVATRNISAGEEIYASYGPVYWRFRD